MIKSIFFDIDGTLLDISGPGKKAIEKTLSKYLGRKIDIHINPRGRTDTYIWSKILNDLGIKREWHEFIENYTFFLEKEMPKYEITPHITEVKKILTELKRRNILLGLVTGNIRAGAKIKLQRYGLWDFFEFGGFGDTLSDRTEIVISALTQCEKLLNAVKNDEILLVGDTVYDVASANNAGIPSVLISRKPVRTIPAKYFITNFKEILSIPGLS